MNSISTLRFLRSLVIVLTFAGAQWISLASYASASQCQGLFDRQNSTPAFGQQPLRPIESTVLRAYRDAWDQPGIYKEGECHGNVCRLFGYLSKSVPGLEMEDVTVLYITPRESWLQGGGPFNVTQARGGFQDGVHVRPQRWNYHVVLEYQGLILDLDNTNQPQTYTVNRYLNEFFFSRQEVESRQGQLIGPREDLVVYRIPGPSYIGVGAWGVGRQSFHEAIALKNRFGPPIPLIDLRFDSSRNAPDND